ncbi:MAG: hypothetical protein QM692_22075 [Thermomicrobiales bacterium]
MSMMHRTLSRRSIWQRAAVAFVGAAVPALAAREPEASANQSGPGVNDNSNWQLAICELGGGHGAVTNVVRYPDWSVGAISTLCTGGYFDGVYCRNSTTLGTICTKVRSAAAPPSDSIPPLTFTEDPPPGLTAALDHMLHATPVDEPPPAPDPSASAPPADSDAGGGPRRKRGKGKGKGRGKRRRS